MSTNTSTKTNLNNRKQLEELAMRVVNLASSHDIKLSVSDGYTVITAYKSFTPGDRYAYADAERRTYEVLRMMHYSRPGSVWGTTSDGVGGYVGLNGGQMTLNKSGISKRLLQKIDKLING